MTIGEIGPGEIWGCEKIIFLDAPKKLNFLASNGDSFVEIFVVARTFSDDIALCMDKDGYFYIGISITNELYFGGDFKETMNKLLLGLDYGNNFFTWSDK